MPSLPEKAFRDALVEVTWAIHLADMPTEAGSVRFPLQSLIPSKDFAVNVVSDEGTPYRFGGMFSEVSDFNIFWSKRDRYLGGVIGSCGIELVPKASMKPEAMS